MVINQFGPLDIYNFSYFYQFYAVDIINKIQSIFGLSDKTFERFCNSEAFAVIEAKIKSVIYQLNNMTNNHRYTIKPKRKVKRKPQWLYAVL